MLTSRKEARPTQVADVTAGSGARLLAGVAPGAGAGPRGIPTVVPLQASVIAAAGFDN